MCCSCSHAKCITYLVKFKHLCMTLNLSTCAPFHFEIVFKMYLNYLKSTPVLKAALRNITGYFSHRINGLIKKKVCLGVIEAKLLRRKLKAEASL